VPCQSTAEEFDVNGCGMGWGTGFGWLWMVGLLVLSGLALAALVKYLLK